MKFFRSAKLGVYWKRNNNKNRIKEMSINLLKQSPMCRCSVTFYTFSIFFASAHLKEKEKFNSIWAGNFYYHWVSISGDKRKWGNAMISGGVFPYDTIIGNSFCCHCQCPPVGIIFCYTISSHFGSCNTWKNIFILNSPMHLKC